MNDTMIIKRMAVLCESMIDKSMDVDKELGRLCEAEEVFNKLKEQQKLLTQYFDESRETGKPLVIEFVRKSDGELRQAEVYNKSKYGPSIYFKGETGKEYLSDITSSGDEIYKTETNVEDAYIIFLEKIADDQVESALNSKYKKNVKNPEEGVYVWYRSFYAKNVRKILFDGEEVWSGDSGDDVIKHSFTSTRVLTRQQIEQAREEAKKAEDERQRKEEESAQFEREAQELAKTMTEDDVRNQYRMANAHTHDSREERLKWRAIDITHDRLMQEDPEKHKMIDMEGAYNNSRGYYSYKCKGCGFGFGWDSSD